jgi:hypothetical protein
MRLIDQQVRDTPFNAIGQMPRRLQNDGRAVNQQRIRRLMRLGEWFRGGIRHTHAGYGGG